MEPIFMMFVHLYVIGWVVGKIAPILIAVVQNRRQILAREQETQLNSIKINNIKDIDNTPDYIKHGIQGFKRTTRL